MSEISGSEAALGLSLTLHRMAAAGRPLSIGLMCAGTALVFIGLYAGSLLSNERDFRVGSGTGPQPHSTPHGSGWPAIEHRPDVRWDRAGVHWAIRRQFVVKLAGFPGRKRHTCECVP